MKVCGNPPDPLQIADILGRSPPARRSMSRLKLTVVKLRLLRWCVLRWAEMVASNVRTSFASQLPTMVDTQRVRSSQESWRPSESLGSRPFGLAPGIIRHV